MHLQPCISVEALTKLKENFIKFLKMNPAGLEPAIPGPVGRCLIHWATGPYYATSLLSNTSPRPKIIHFSYPESCNFL